MESRPTNIDVTHAGIGLRSPHYQDMLRELPPVSFLEIHSENFFCDGGQPLAYLEKFRAHYPISTHGVGLSIGSSDNLNKEHLCKLKRLIDRIEPALVSEHLCWSHANGRYLNDLLPLPYTDEALAHVVNRVNEVQDRLQRTIMVENVSSYLEFSSSTIPEWEFIAELSRRSGCRILLDVNNIYVNAVNHDFDADIFLNAITPGSVGEIHLAGFDASGDCLIDTHGSAVSDAVWTLYEKALARFGPVPTLIEWDADIPPLATLLDEAAKATNMLRHAGLQHAA